MPRALKRLLFPAFALASLAPACVIHEPAEVRQQIVSVDEHEREYLFAPLRALEGRWEGQDASGATLAVEFHVSSGGSAVSELMLPGTAHEMINMYHVNGDELRVTHYCSAGNQPEMTLDRAASRPDELVFTFAGGTGFDPAKDMHIHGGRITLKGDAMDIAWSAWAGGKDAGVNRGTLKRADGKAGK